MERMRTDSGATYFGALAENYDRLQPVVAGPSYTAGLAMMVDLVPHDSGERFHFVELGCGTAELSRKVLNRFGAATGMAIDAEPAMVRMAGRKLAALARRAEARQGDILSAELPACDLVLASKVLHHVPPDRMPELFGGVARALRPGGCLLAFDGMVLGPAWGDGVRRVLRRDRRLLIEAAVAAGRTTWREVQKRRAFKRAMKAQGRDVEYSHEVEGVLAAMSDAGFAEAAVVWRMFADTILMAFTPPA
jgi:SAM-dependent methyltransferase